MLLALRSVEGSNSKTGKPFWERLLAAVLPVAWRVVRWPAYEDRIQRGEGRGQEAEVRL